MTIGFVGLGKMGAPMAARMANAFPGMLAFDVNEAAGAEVIDAGAIRAGSLTEVAACDIVFLSLPTPPVVEAVSADLLAHKRSGRVVDLSTTGPDVARAVSARAAEAGVTWIDAPVSGGVGGARAGTIAVMVSGPDADYVALTPYFQAIGKPFHVGHEAGLAQTMKLVNNLLSAAATALSVEAIALGAKAGLRPEIMVDVINASSGANTATGQKFPRSILPGTFDYGFSTGLMHKDVALFTALADEAGAELHACRAVKAMWDRALATYGPDSDFTEIAKLTEADLNVSLRASRD